MEQIDRRKNNGSIWAGLIVLFIGAVLLLRQMDFPIPHWLISWPMLLIVIGIFMGVKNNFQSSGWFIMLLIGGIFLINDILPQWEWHQYIWPMGLIAIGIFLIVKPRKKNWSNMGDWNSLTGRDAAAISNDDMLDITTVFGGTHRNIISKDFKGGEVVTVFGGTEINLVQADINGKIVLDVTQIFGGTKLIVPSNWEIKSEVTAIFGGTSDKRAPHANYNLEKVLILKGTSIFGGIEIVSY
jgi:predicted membrane protein